MTLRTLQVTICLIGFALFAGGSGNPAARAEPGAGNSPQPSPMASPTIDQVLKKHGPHLLAIPGVEGVARGRCGNRPCLRVYVRHRTPELEQKIPAILEGYPVVIEESGEIRPLPEKKPTPKKN